MRRVFSLPIVVVALGTACATGQPELQAPAVPAGARIDIPDPAFGAYVGSTLRLTAVVRAGGVPPRAADTRVAWRSSDLSRAWITEDGTVTLFAPGRVTITATYGDLQATRTLDVLESRARAVDLRGEPLADVRVGVPIRLFARVTGNDGPLPDAHVRYVVAAGPPDRDPGAATVTDDGVFTASVAGVYTVIAEFGGKADEVTMLVGMPGTATAPATGEVESFVIESGEYTAYSGTTLPLAGRVMRRGEGRPVRNPRIHWASSDTDVAWVGQDGVVVFEGPGRVTITAEHGTAVAKRTFDVTPNPARRIVLDTNAKDVHPADTVRLRASVWSLGGQPVRNARVNYGVVGHTVGAVDGGRVLDGGRFVATKPGLYTIVAELGGLADSQTILVRPRVSGNRDR
jgi:hypothetical protein